ncbi:hypothetical protein DFH08DRAFT_819493 [Mycena albidolilacea]|uniref:Uncharacterized protein n=1 Tax=Mycena albidolilacea TaxID=1033008 RepID=A0AAD7EF15_9AGAR|nr:hypothetical protein DFH08DRAFT_819493 [Mycena albidolilacea]
MSSAEVVPMFSSNPNATSDSSSHEPSSNLFLKKFRVHMHDLGITDPGDYISTMVDYFKDDSPAKKWFHEERTSATPATTWGAMEQAFLRRFPGPQAAERSKQEWERELLGMRITVEELDKTVDVGGTEVFAHIRFAECLLQVRDALPEVIHEKVKAMQTDWVTFTAKIKGIEREHICEGVAKAKKAKEMECVVSELACNRSTPKTPTTPISKMAAQLARAGLQSPSQPVRNPPPVNPFGGEGGGKGNLFTPPVQLGENDKAQLERVAARLGRALLADDAAGCAEYMRHINIWNAQFGGACILLERTGYPLSPGTAAPGSGECFGCGKVTTPYHRRAECPGPPVPAKESTFCTLCAKHLAPPPAQSGPEWWVGWKERKLVGETGKAEDFMGDVSFTSTPTRQVSFENTVWDKNDGHKFTGALRNGNDTTDEGGVDLALTTGVEEVGDQPGDGAEEARCQEATQAELEVEADANWWLPEAVPPSREISAGVSATPVRGVLNAVDGAAGECTDTDRTGGKEPGNSHGGTERSMWWAKEQGEIAVKQERVISVGAGATPARGVHEPTTVLHTAEHANTSAEETLQADTELYNIDAYLPEDQAPIFTRATDPFNPARVKHILELIQVGNDLTANKKAAVRALITKYADTFALAHTRWRDGIMGYQIVGAEHVKGANSTVADALSWADEGTPKVYRDGSGWTVSPD